MGSDMLGTRMSQVRCVREAEAKYGWRNILVPIGRVGAESWINVNRFKEVREERRRVSVGREVTLVFMRLRVVRAWVPEDLANDERR